jgi:hypothetical protein
MVLRKVGYGVFVGNKEEDNKNDKDEESKVSCAKARHRESGSVVAMQNRETSTVHVRMSSGRKEAKRISGAMAGGWSQVRCM